MLFRRVILCALFVGFLAGGLLTAVQHLQVIPLIAAAERLENAGAAVSMADAPAHEHAKSAWAPADGSERHLWTLASNITTAIGLALLLLPAMAAWDARRPTPVASPANGLLWGAAGYLAFFAVPGIGLPPEIPGAARAALSDRQAWWLLAVACSVLAFGLVGLSRHPWRWLAIGLVAVPFALGAPELGIDPFAGHSPAIAARMHGLAQEFILATALSIGLYWLALGAAGGFAVRRWLRPALRATVHGEAGSRASDY